MPVEIFMPKMSDHMEAGEFVEWLVAEGAAVEKGQALMLITTDKATVELEAPAAGILKGVRPGIIPGASIPVGETIAFIAVPDEPVPALPGLGGAAASPAAPVPPAPTPPPLSAPAGPARTSPFVRKLAKELGVALEQVLGSGPEGRITEQDVRAHAEAPKAPPPVASEPAPDTGAGASPLAARLAKDLGVDLARVKGTGPHGRITKEDVQTAASTQAPPAAVAPGASETPEWIDLTPIQRLTGQRLLQSVQTAPQFALSIDVDMTAALAARQAFIDASPSGERPSVTAVLIRVVAAVLREMPRVNACFDNGRLKVNPRVNVGIAVGTDNGLAVPVIKDADRKSLPEIACELKAFQENAAALRFSQADLSGSTFTISNLGMYGIDRFHAIVNPPESAILAVGRIVKLPVGLPNDQVALRPMLTLTLSIDHRVLDGVVGAKFLAAVRARLEQPYLLI